MAGYKLISFDKISSTQTHAHDLIASGVATDCTAIVARRQISGRGRHHRTWVSNPGNLYVSFIYKNSKPDGRLAYAVAVAVACALGEFGIATTIKWPNDILVDGKKICGILIEYVGDFVVVGIGINIKSNPVVSAGYETTRMDLHTDHVPDAMGVLHKLMRQMDVWRGAPYADVRDAWMERAALVGATITHGGAAATLVGIDDDGALILNRNGENIRVYGDEISIYEK
ncbi:biotin--[acetyl-CoA-carboxylase] ligase [bacterium]|nr:biotin--[acetyl-CoA-carboxylase] ligase [bacterium]